MFVRVCGRRAYVQGIDRNEGYDDRLAIVWTHHKSIEAHPYNKDHNQRQQMGTEYDQEIDSCVFQDRS